MSKKIPKKSKKRLIIFGIPCLIIILYFLFQLAFYMYKIYDLKKEQRRLKDEYSELKINEKELRTEIDKLNDPDYIARYARETYSYSKNGEYIIKLKDNEKEKIDISFTQYILNILSNINIDYPYIIFGVIAIIIFIIIFTSKKKS